ncbi:unnamed protein product [Pedinophyceae sp. YPF-701]|nr:unnamed protein product [Pedinophyceae sp. YPF-701]
MTSRTVVKINGANARAPVEARPATSERPYGSALGSEKLPWAGALDHLENALARLETRTVEAENAVRTAQYALTIVEKMKLPSTKHNARAPTVAAAPTYHRTSEGDRHRAHLEGAPCHRESPELSRGHHADAGTLPRATSLAATGIKGRDDFRRARRAAVSAAIGASRASVEEAQKAKQVIDEIRDHMSVLTHSSRVALGQRIEDTEHRIARALAASAQQSEAADHFERKLAEEEAAVQAGPRVRFFTQGPDAASPIRPR